MSDEGDQPRADDPRPEPPLLAIQFRARSVALLPEQAVQIRDSLRAIEGNVERRLATLVEAKTTELLAAPLYAGTVTLRIDLEEEAALLALLGRWAEDGELPPDSERLTRLRAELDDRPKTIAASARER